MKQKISNDLNFNVILQTGSISFLQLALDMKFDAKNHFIPKLGPPKQTQHNRPCCGFVAFWSGVKAGDSSISIPPVYKKDFSLEDKEEKNKMSLRAKGKAAGITGFGPIYNIEHFNVMAEWVGLEGSHVMNLPHSRNEYIEEICSKVRAGYRIIIAADVSKHFPSNQKGERTHWALIFGYFYYNNQYYFLVHQYGNYYGWSANNLFEANKNLPEHNPIYGKYYKNKTTKQYKKLTDTFNDDPKFLTTHKIYTVEEKDLNKFRFCGFAIPSKVQPEIFEDLSSLIANSEKIIFNEIKQEIKKNYQEKDKLLLSLNNYCNTLRRKPQAARRYQHYLNGIKICIDSYIDENKLSKVPGILYSEPVIAIYESLEKCIFDYVRNGELEKLKQIKAVYKDTCLDVKNIENKSALMIAITSQKFDIALWLLINKANDQLMDNARKNARFYLKETLIHFENKNTHLPKVFNQALEEKSPLKLTNLCICACLKQEDGIKLLHKIINIYFLMQSCHSGILSSFFFDKEKDPIKIQIIELINAVFSLERPDLIKIYNELYKLLFIKFFDVTQKNSFQTILEKCFPLEAKEKYKELNFNTRSLC